MANRADQLDHQQRQMATLLAKFRIDYSDVIAIPDVTKKASPETKAEFEKMIAGCGIPEEELKEEEGRCLAPPTPLSRGPLGRRVQVDRRSGRRQSAGARPRGSRASARTRWRARTPGARRGSRKRALPAPTRGAGSSLCEA